MDDVPLPVHPDPAYKFKSWPDRPACGSGVEVWDHSILMSGEPCCTSCRAKIVLADGAWVHA